jgi:hypothetical protein
MTSKIFRGNVSSAQAHRLREQAKRTKKAARSAKLARLAKATAGTQIKNSPLVK